MQPQINLIGELLDGRYKVSSFLGVGGMGSVFAAHDTVLNRKVAIKIIHIHILSNNEYRSRFEREAKLLAQLDDSHLTALYAYGYYADYVPYLVTEFLEGTNLAIAIMNDKPLAIGRTLNIILQLCEALHYIHDKGVVHRDLKPQNIMLVKQNDNELAKLVDFGLAKIIFGNEKLTVTGDLLGTPQYLSPEQCKGIAADERSDIYALGCIMYECLAGHAPFVAENSIGLLYKHINESPVALSQINTSIPVQLDTLILKALEKDPEKRFQTAADFGNAIKVFLQDSTLRDVGISTSKPETKANQKNKLLITLTLVVLAVVSTYLALFTSANTRIANFPEQDEQSKIIDETTRELKQLEHSAHTDEQTAEIASQSCRAMAHELSSVRDAKALCQAEFSSLDTFSTIAIVGMKNEKSNMSWIRPLVIAADNETKKGHYHNAGELYLFAAVSASNSNCAVSNFCQSAKSFARAGEPQLIRKAFLLARKRVSSISSPPPVLSAQIEFTEFLVFYPLASESTVDSFINEFHKKLDSLSARDRCNIYAQIAELYQGRNEIDKANHYFELAATGSPTGASK